MHAVVNLLTFADTIPEGLFPSAERDLAEGLRAVPGFEGLRIAQTSDTTAVLLIFGDSPETLDRLATELGSPWMREHVVPLLAGPPQRNVGAIVADIPA